MGQRLIGSVILTIAFFTPFLSVAEGGTVLQLSDLSSDETDAALLSASLTFTLGDNRLSLDVANETGSADGFDINAVYFNAAADVAGLVLDPSPGWTMLTDQRADGFGVFDFALIGGVGNDPSQIASQETRTFTFDVIGESEVSESAFTSAFSTIPPGSRPSLAAIKFVNGPGDDSAFGAVVPEPASVLLLGIGALFSVRLVQRRR